MMGRVASARRYGLGLLLSLLFGCAVAIAAQAQSAERTALLMPGKTSLYQRILSRPGARLQEVPGAAGRALETLPPLSVFHVYDRREVDGRSWLEIGSAAEDDAQGWIDGALAIDWRQTLTVAFTRTGARDPALFFRSQDALVDLLSSEHRVRDTDRMRAQIARGPIPPGFPVIAAEPDTYVDPNREFYLLPILGYRQVYLDSGHSTNALNVAAVTLQAGEQDLLSADDPAIGRSDRAARAKDYRAGVVFVIDTTSSMGPYIDRTRAAVRQIYDRLRASDIGDALSFGLVAFRDNTEAAPGLDYVSRVAATLEDGRDASGFFSKVSRVEPAAASSRGFNEDAYAGVYDAIEEIDWRGYAGRYVVLITDAGARDARDPLARTGLGAERLRLMAQEKDQTMGGGKIAIAALHLLTSEGRHTHARAAAQYRALSRWGDAGDLYFPVDGGSVEAFGVQVDSLTDALLAQLQRARAGELIEPPEGDDVPEIARRTALVGRAMQLAYLGRETGSRAPRLIDAWVSDRGLVDPAVKSLEVRVLISKNQLSDLQETLEAILDAGEQTFMSARDFFNQLRGAAAALARNPDDMSQMQVKRLADVGLVGEWLDDLPYTSQVMNLTESRWLSRSYAEQQEVLDAIEEKIRLYRRIHDDTDRWIALTARGRAGESVTTIPLDALP